MKPSFLIGALSLALSGAAVAIDLPLTMDMTQVPLCRGQAPVEIPETFQARFSGQYRDDDELRITMGRKVEFDLRDGKLELPVVAYRYERNSYGVLMTGEAAVQHCLKVAAKSSERSEELKFTLVRTEVSWLGITNFRTIFLLGKNKRTGAYTWGTNSRGAALVLFFMPAGGGSAGGPSQPTQKIVE